MKIHTLCTWTLLSLLLVTAGAAGCAREISHTESEKPNWFGDGSTRKESTVYEKPDGTTVTESSVRTTR